MAGKDAAEGSGRRRMDLNLYVGQPPLPPPQVRLDTSAASSAVMANSTGAAPEAPRTGEPKESLSPMAVTYSSSNALSAPEESQMLDPIVYSWLDGSSAGAGEEYTDALQPAAPAYGLNVSGPATWSVGEDDDLLAARSVRPSRLAAAVGIMEMVNTSTLVQSTGGVVDAAAAAGTRIEAGAPELRFHRLIQISQQHNIADNLARAIQQTHCSFAATRRQNSDGSDNSSFECNICLEVARQPVVTSCGHLFCWPCLYQWLHEHSPFSECPVCKGEVLRGDISPIYGRGGEQGESTANNPNLPPRPQANRREGLRRQLQMAVAAGNPREMARLLRQMTQNQNQNQSYWDARDLPPMLPRPVGVETTSVPASRQRASARRQRRQVTSGSRGSNQNQLPHSNAAQVLLAAPQQSLPVEQLPTSSTAAAGLGEPGSSRGSRRPSESQTIRRTRRRPQ